MIFYSIIFHSRIPFCICFVCRYFPVDRISLNYVASKLVGPIFELSLSLSLPPPSLSDIPRLLGGISPPLYAVGVGSVAMFENINLFLHYRSPLWYNFQFSMYPGTICISLLYPPAFPHFNVCREFIYRCSVVRARLHLPRARNVASIIVG